MKSALEILQNYWGYTSFRKPQKAIIDSVIKGEDVVAVLPTGSGKSLCYQVPALMYEEGVCIVVSPLIALMEDQVAHLEKNGIKAIALTGYISENTLTRVFDNIKFSKKIRFLYLSPERLQNPFIQEKIKELQVSLIAVDEAHCVSEWGHDFRPAYLQIAVLRELHPEVPVLAVTATATQRVIEDIQTYLQLKAPKRFIQTLSRPNIRLKVEITQPKRDRIIALLKPLNEPAIVYAGTRKNCIRISDLLNSKGISSVYYHAGLSYAERENAFELWYSEKVRVIVATNAFGMGIDKANVRMIIHSHLPYTLENYVQESGRAGRDGLAATAIIIEDKIQVKKALESYKKTLPDAAFVRQVYDKLNQYFQITYGDLPQTPFAFDIATFCNRYTLDLLKTYHAISFLENESILRFATGRHALTQLRIKAGNTALFSYYQRNPDKEKLLKSLLRTYEGITRQFTQIDLYRIARKNEKNVSEIKRLLLDLERDVIIDLQHFQAQNYIQFLVPREDVYTWNIIKESVRQRVQHKEEKFKSVLRYIANTETCRMQQLNRYFSQAETPACGVCDVCMTKNTKEKLTDAVIRSKIVNLLQKEPLNSQDMCIALAVEEKKLLKQLEFLLDTGAIVVNSQNKYQVYES